jgi:hypothetical protein
MKIEAYPLSKMEKQQSLYRSIYRLCITLILDEEHILKQK